MRDGLRQFAEALQTIELDDEVLAGAIAMMTETSLPVVCSGVGKSGFIAAKLVATLNSLGIRATYLNPTDALHGDVGFVDDGSVVILISNSGATSELTNLVPSLQARTCKIISIVSNPASPLGKAANYVIAYGKVREADEHGLAPTTSTVVQLALADVLAATVSRNRGFRPNDFYRNHPSGALGKRLMTVDALMRSGDRLPVVGSNSPLVDVLSEITSKHIGCTCVTDSAGKLVGLITDGDIRRALAQRVDVYTGSASEIMQRKPQVAHLGGVVEQLMQRDDYLGRHFTVPVVDDSNHLHGILVSIDLI